MNCPFCQNPLRPEAFAVWSIGSRKLFEYRCRQPQCTLSVMSPDKISVELTLPDYEVVSYTFLFTINDKWYRIFSHSGAPNKQVTKPKTIFFGYEKEPGPFSPGYNEKDVILTMERFLPLDWNTPIEVQVEAARTKLKTLLPFL